MCLYLATRDDVTSDQKVELEDAARFEDDRNPRFPETHVRPRELCDPHLGTVPLNVFQPKDYHGYPDPHIMLS